MKQELLKKEIEILHGIDINASGNTISIKGPRGELIKSFVNPDVKTEINNGKIVLHANNATKREKRMIGTFSAHLKNRIHHLQGGCFALGAGYGDDKDIFSGEAIPQRSRQRQKIMIYRAK